MKYEGIVSEVFVMTCAATTLRRGRSTV